MARQEINLHRSFESPYASSDLFSWKRLWISNAIVVFLLILIYLFSLLELFQLNFTHKSLTNKTIALQKQFNEIKHAYPPVFFTQDVKESINQIEKDIQAREAILATITNNAPFSQVLLALGEVIVPSVWLTQITFAKGGQEVILKGNSTGMNNLQGFLVNLMKHKLFTGGVLNINQIDKPSSDKNETLTFEISVVKKRNE